MSNRYTAKEIYSDPAVAEQYDESRFATLGGRLFDRIEKHVLHAHLPIDKSAAILEVGSGTGRFILSLAELGYRNLAATDISPALLKILELKAAERGYSEILHTSIGDIYNLKAVESKSIDLIYSIRVLNQLRDDSNRTDAIRELLRVTRPGGMLVFDIVNQNSLAGLVSEYPQTTVKTVREIIAPAPGQSRITHVIHRMSLSQTLMEKSGWPLAYLVYGLDRLVSAMLPFWGTRVYFVIQRDT